MPATVGADFVASLSHGDLKVMDRTGLESSAYQCYWSSIRPTLANIAESSALLKRGRGMSVSLSMPPGLAATWFMRRMTHLLNRHPEIELHLNATALTVDFERESVDLAIRHFNGQDKRLEAPLLLKDEACVYCTPAYAKTHKLTKPKALVGTTIVCLSASLRTTRIPLFSSKAKNAWMSSSNLPAVMLYEPMMLTIPAPFF